MILEIWVGILNDKMLALQKVLQKNFKKVMWHNMIGFLKIWIYLSPNHVVPHHFVKVLVNFFVSLAFLILNYLTALFPATARHYVMPNKYEAIAC